MMSGLASRIGEGRSGGVGGFGAEGTFGGIRGIRGIRSSGVVRFAVKMIGIGLCAGLALCCCQFLIDTFFRSIR